MWNECWHYITPRQVILWCGAALLTIVNCTKYGNSCSLSADSNWLWWVGRQNQYGNNVDHVLACHAASTCELRFHHFTQTSPGRDVNSLVWFRGCLNTVGEWTQFQLCSFFFSPWWLLTRTYGTWGRPLTLHPSIMKSLAEEWLPTSQLGNGL